MNRTINSNYNPNSSISSYRSACVAVSFSVRLRSRDQLGLSPAMRAVTPHRTEVILATTQRRVKVPFCILPRGLTTRPSALVPHLGSNTTGNSNTGVGVSTLSFNDTS